MSEVNGNRTIENRIIEKFIQTFNIFHLYEFSYKIYKNKEPHLHRKYSNLFSCIHLMNTRSVLQQKETQFIKQWKNAIESPKCLNYLPHTHELLKLLEIIDERLKQTPQFIQFLNEMTRVTWERLESSILATLHQLRSAAIAILKTVLAKEQVKINSPLKTRIQLVIQAPNTNNNRPEAAQPEYEDFKSLQTIRQVEEPHLHSSNANSPYQVSSIKFFVKEKPQPIKLLTKEELESLRREIMDRKKSTTITADGSVKQKQSDKATDYKQKSQNYNTYHTQISEDSDECSSNEDQNKLAVSNSFHKVKRKDLGMGKHHKSNFENARNIKKMLEAKENSQKYNSIHKIEGINSAGKYNKSIEEPPSRNTIETSSINRFASPDNPIEATVKKSRMNKISIMGKLERTIKKIQVKNLKKPRGGMYIPDEKLKQIEEIYRCVKHDELDEKSSNSNSDQDSANESNSTAFQEGQPFKEKLNTQDKRISEFIECSSQKDHQKYKRRFGVSSKVVNSNKSIDWYSVQAKQMSDKHKYSQMASRTSIFRSSGSNFEEKKSISKSRYNYHESSKKLRINKSQKQQYYDERDSRQFEEMAKKFVLSKKSNQKLYNDHNIFNIDKRALVSSSQMTKVLTQIHEQEKLDRSSKYEDYYDQVLRRKYEGQSRNSNQNNNQKPTNSFKMENGVEERTSRKQKSMIKEESLFDFMIKNIKTAQQLELKQIGIQTFQQSK